MFGCLCYAQTISSKHTKFHTRARSSIFGFPSNIKGYVVFDLKNHDVKVSQNISFYISSLTIIILMKSIIKMVYVCL